MIEKGKMGQAVQVWQIDEFNQQHDLAVGGFDNPQIVSTSKQEICFQCHYDNCSGDVETWIWYLDRYTGVFHK